MTARTRLVLRFAAFPATVAVVGAGIWLTGGVVTDDFAFAMWLTAGWLGLAGLVTLAIGRRSRAFRLPVVGAYVLTAAVIGVYLGMSILVDNVVDEEVAMAAPENPEVESPGAPTGEPAEPQNVLLRAGSFESVRHTVAGRAEAIELAQGGRVLTLTNFEVDNGPDLRVYLVAGPATTEDEVDDLVDLGGLKGNRGDQQYDLPADVELDRYSTVVIWCRAFSVLFARAPLDT